MLEYNGYIAKIDVDETDEYMHGEVINIRDVITFKGKSLDELKSEFKNSIESYQAFCKRKGIDPDKPFSGKIILRMEPDLHRELYAAAKSQGVSLNKYIAHTLEASTFKTSCEDSRSISEINSCSNFDADEISSSIAPPDTESYYLSYLPIIATDVTTPIVARH